MKINLTQATITDDELRAAADVLRSGWLIRGKHAKAFEEEFSGFAQAMHGVATNGCTMALYIALKYMDLKPDDEVIVPALTWSATASAVVNAGAIPVFADVNGADWCLDPEDVKRKMTERTKLVLPVHFAGRYAHGFDDFMIPVLFDSAHRIAKDDFRDIPTCHSFYAVKNMTTVRGGMILTNDAAAAKWYAMACHGGMAKDTLSRYVGIQDRDAASFYYEAEHPGFNFDMTDVEAAIGREQLKKIEAFNAKREAIVGLYNAAFGLENSGNHLYPILVSNRDEFLVQMQEAGIQCGIHYLPLHLMKAYKTYARESLPVTEFIGAHCVSLPLFADMTTAEVAYVIESTKKHASFVKIPK